MMALSNKMLDHEPSEIELLLPWYAAGTLNARDMRRVEEALASDPDLARQYAEIQGEYAETIALNETLGAPSMRAMQKLFAAIDADPTQKPAVAPGIGFGEYGEGFVRLGLVENEHRIRQAARNVRKVMQNADALLEKYHAEEGVAA